MLGAQTMPALHAMRFCGSRYKYPNTHLNTGLLQIFQRKGISKTKIFKGKCEPNNGISRKIGRGK